MCRTDSTVHSGDTHHRVVVRPKDRKHNQDHAGSDGEQRAALRIRKSARCPSIPKQVYGSPGEHIGLSIIRERASRLGGKLQVESEPGEGTRIVLELNQPAPASNLT